MVSMTDCVVDGLKYPFKDIKKVLSFGILFSIINVISLFISFKSLDLYRATLRILEKRNGGELSLKFSQLPSGEVYTITILAIISFIIILFILGYEYDIVKFSIEKKESLPRLDDILNIFKKGIKYFIVALAYNIIPAIILSVGIALVHNSLILSVIFIISMILFIIAFFIQIMALNNMIAYDKLSKAFDLREIINNISNLGWGKYIGIILFTSIIYMIIMSAVGVILSFLTVLFTSTINNQVFIVLTFISIITGLFINSYLGVFLNRVCGSIYRESIK
ncbi:DUF4013 domain-containing protein [uncultured Methanobrevibacter sp.]|uniref:DUF4013 domain-containing protein n=1 Tax=uncultured Methanobrevibacter sp. TaxID=253161 RepID=UPI0025CCD75D|nr:DUF4013 domain-containing protein [uncultured Methanobrevibacter sp.]